MGRAARLNFFSKVEGHLSQRKLWGPSTKIIGKKNKATPSVPFDRLVISSHFREMSKQGGLTCEIVATHRTREATRVVVDLRVLHEAALLLEGERTLVAMELVALAQLVHREVLLERRARHKLLPAARLRAREHLEERPGRSPRPPLAILPSEEMLRDRSPSASPSS